MSERLAACSLIIMAVTAYVTYRGFKQPAFQDRFIFEPTRILRDEVL